MIGRVQEPFFDETVSVLRQAPLVPEESCIVVIDMQNFNGDREGAEGKTLTGPENDYYWENLEKRATPNIAKLIKSARAKGIEVMYTCVEALTADGRDRGIDYKLSGFCVPKGSWDGEVLPDIAPEGDEIVLPKGSSSLWMSTKCAALLPAPPTPRDGHCAYLPRRCAYLLLTCSASAAVCLVCCLARALGSSSVGYLLRGMGMKQVVMVGALTDQCVESAIRDACDDNFLVTQATDACVTFSEERHETSINAIKGYCRQRTTDELIEEIDALAPSAYMNKDKSMLGTAGMAVAPDLVPATATADAEK